MLSPTTLTVPTDKPVQVFGSDGNGLAIITNVGGLDYQKQLPGPSDVVLGTAFSLTNLQQGISLAILPSTYLLLIGASITMPTLDTIYALALSAQTTVTIVKGVRDL